MVSRRRVLALGCLALAGNVGCLGESNAGVSGDTASESDGSTDDSTSETDHTGSEADETTSETDGATEFRITVTNGDETVELATTAGVASVGEIEQSPRGDDHRLPVVLTDEAADAFADGLDAIGAYEDPSAHEIHTHLGGERLNTAMLGADFAAAVEEGRWDGRFLAAFLDREEAEKLKETLEGA
ncbi:preprotein translocase subunit SecD family protein [Halorussus amylolyticus]|uniref:hypothetical protein n=1 Tax=Halorussus amylolyticus TaxID=1126242 RepID=UPI00104CF9BD|nr:hypothetical protein [Halorussus amylolyticus]